MINILIIGTVYDRISLLLFNHSSWFFFSFNFLLFLMLDAEFFPEKRKEI